MLELYVVCMQHLLDTLCRDVETDLRLHIHMHLQLDSRNPFRIASKQLSTFLRMTPIRLFEQDINARGNPSSLFANIHEVCSAGVVMWLSTVAVLTQLLRDFLQPKYDTNFITYYSDLWYQQFLMATQDSYLSV